MAKSRLSKVPVMEASAQAGSMQSIGKKFVVSAGKVKSRIKTVLGIGVSRATGLQVAHFYAPKSKVIRSTQESCQAD